MVSEKAPSVATPCLARLVMACDWKLIDDLNGGTRSMRSAGKRWLPKEDAESEPAYTVRINRSFLYEAYQDTLRRLRSKPFSRPVTLKGAVPDRLAGLEKNVDGEGQDITQFGGLAFDHAGNRGLIHILVDFPDVAAGPDETAEERAQRVTLDAEQKLRPTFTLITADDMLGWEKETAADGTVELTMIRFRECVVEKSGEWGEVRIEQVRVVRKTTWEIHRQVEGAWSVAKHGTNSLGKVALATAYFNRTGFMTAEPPLRALAWLNLQHWCSSSDQNHILRFSRFGFLFGAGFSDEEKKDQIVIGPARIIRSSNKDAKLTVVEGNCEGVKVGRQDLLDIEERMEVMGLQPLMSRTGDATATGQKVDSEKTTCDVQAWVRALEGAFIQAFKFAAEWVKVTLPDDFAVDVFSEFGLSQRATQDIEQLIKMRQAREISRLTFLREVRRRALLSDSVDPEQEARDVEEETPVDGFTGTKGDAGDPAADDGQPPSKEAA